MRDDADLTTDAGDPSARPASARIRHLDIEALSLHIDGALDGSEGLEAERHLASCSDCAMDFTELRMTVSLLQALPQYAPRRSFTLGPEYGKIKRRALQESPAQRRQEPERPASPYLPPSVPAAQPSWFDHLLPGAGALKIATGFVGLALLATLVGDAIVPDPAPRQSIAMNSAQVATSILP
ncbi:MAG: anti-sigma factor family protein, partial [Thermomicrobiales bacterium]